MSSNGYENVYFLIAEILQEKKISYPFDPIKDLSKYFPDVSLIPYSSLEKTDCDYLRKYLPTGLSIKGTKSNKLQIYYNDIDCAIPRQRFTILHELGHHLLGHSGFLETSNLEENYADCFARNLLSPVSEIIKRGIPLSVSAISSFFGISSAAANCRINLFSLDDYFLNCAYDVILSYRNSYAYAY